MNTILGKTLDMQSGAKADLFEIIARYSILLRVLSLNIEVSRRFSDEMVNVLRRTRPDFFQEAFELLLEESSAMNANDVATLLRRHSPLPGQWERLISKMKILAAGEGESSGPPGVRRRRYIAALANVLVAWYDNDSRTSDVIELINNTRNEVQSSVLRALEGGLYEPRLGHFLGNFIFSEGIPPESLANAVAVILAGEGWCANVEEWLFGIILQVMTFGLEEFPYGEMKVLSDYLFATHNERDAHDSDLHMVKVPSQEVVDHKIITMCLPLLCHNNFAVRRELLYILKALVPSSDVLRDCALSLLKSENLDWVDCALFVLNGVQLTDVREARALLAQNTDLFARWLVDEDAAPSVFDIIEELCVEGYFKELPAVNHFEYASASLSRFLGMLIRVKAAVGLITVSGELNQYLASSNHEILKGAIDACRYLGKWNAQTEFLLRSIAYDGSHLLWKDAVTVLQERKWRREGKEAEQRWASRRDSGGVPRWLYPLLPKIVSWAQDGHNSGFRMAFNALRSSVDAPEVRSAIVGGVVSYFRDRPTLVSSPLSQVVSDAIPIDELVTFALLGKGRTSI